MLASYQASNAAFLAYWLPWIPQEYVGEFATIDLEVAVKFSDPVLLDLRNLSDATDWFLIASGDSDTHARAIADNILVLDDGRVVYSRWEYSDKDQNRVQSLWTTNQDGTGTAVLWGNQSIWPDHLAEPQVSEVRVRTHPGIAGPGGLESEPEVRAADQGA